ncbi:hypothetical protein CKF54_07370 [Psittacicella hinzii]|uniref:Antitoxin SocA-like Panacea domain-containing protein n=1 Tax=Psittacicella hinzii TaxID=2028575 RepID=A0A3A1Y4S1_9GAMM|nr:type II toxin-antitoxin system antitoxin SocA domain-containing protein [Psittacicella hinzii]RIY31157.1 hypothetical protein CKF54_07370 [Psittacicella hinzii]
MIKKYVFDDVDILATYLYSLKREISPIQLQKALYFLYAFYVGMYYKNEEISELEGDITYPNELFEANFEAWMYGPVIRSVYNHRREGSKFYQDNLDSKVYKDFIENLLKEPYGEEVLKFVDGLFAEISSRSDFSLVERSHQDYSWKDAFATNEKLMPRESIIDEYVKGFRE